MNYRYLMHKRFLTIGIVFCMFTLNGCTIFQAQKTKLNFTAATVVDLNLQDYDGSFFTMKIPEGWTIETTGNYESFGFKLYDPNKPTRQIFYYGNMSPFTKDLYGRQAWQRYINEGGYTSSQIYVDVPYLDPATTEEFFYKFDDFASVANQYGINHDFPVLSDLEILERLDRNSAMQDIAVDDAMIRGLHTQDGVLCEGLYAATVVDAMTAYMYGTDAGYYTVYVIMGISAPADEFSQLETQLAESVSSFQFSQDYIDQGVQLNEWETAAALQVGETLAAAADSYNQAWSNRQASDDALSQKRSDGMLGYDRLYDSETGKTYKAEIGFFDEYDTKRSEYSNPNLQLVPDDGYSYYSEDISGYINK
jgi:hypothetical protein